MLCNSRFRRDKILHGNGDVIFFRCFGSATPSECATAAAAALVAQSARATRRRIVAMCREGWNYLLIPSQRRLRGYRALSAGGFAVAVISIAAKICGVVGGPPADD